MPVHRSAPSNSRKDNPVDATPPRRSARLRAKGDTTVSSASESQPPESQLPTGQGSPIAPRDLSKSSSKRQQCLLTIRVPPRFPGGRAILRSPIPRSPLPPPCRLHLLSCVGHDDIYSAFAHPYPYGTFDPFKLKDPAHGALPFTHVIRIIPEYDSQLLMNTNQPEKCWFHGEDGPTGHLTYTQRFQAIDNKRTVDVLTIVAPLYAMSRLQLKYTRDFIDISVDAERWHWKTGSDVPPRSNRSKLLILSPIPPALDIPGPWWFNRMPLSIRLQALEILAVATASDQGQQDVRRAWRSLERTRGRDAGHLFAASFDQLPQKEQQMLKDAAAAEY